MVGFVGPSVLLALRVASSLAVGTATAPTSREELS